MGMRELRFKSVFAAALACLPAAGLVGTATANAGSLPQKEGTGPQPGPAVLYEPLASSSQLENAPMSPWHAKPILISGASAYRMGEFVYQGYLYDDHGAKLTADPLNPMTKGGGGDAFSSPDGTYDYPTGKGYDENAANLLELRVKPAATATLFRVSLNALENPNLVATAIAIGGTEGVNHPFPFGANVSAPAQYFLTIHGETAALTNAETGAEVPGPAPTVSVDPVRRQITVSVSHSEWNPGSSVVRLAGGVGLWDSSTNKY